MFIYTAKEFVPAKSKAKNGKAIPVTGREGL
jgi:hypothetical protein